jgi:hypothetical protein
MKKYLLLKNKFVLPQTSQPNLPTTTGALVGNPLKNKVSPGKIGDPQSSILDSMDFSKFDLSGINLTEDDMDDEAAKFFAENPNDAVDMEFKTPADRGVAYQNLQIQLPVLAITQPQPVLSYEKFYIGQNTNRLIPAVAAICSTLNDGGPAQWVKAKALNQEIKAICNGTQTMEKNPSGALSKACLGKSGYDAKCAEYNKTVEEPLLSILERKEVSRRLQWSTVFPGHLAARIFSQNRTYKSLAEIALLPIPEWPSIRDGKPVIYEANDYGRFLEDFVNHFQCTVGGLPVHVVMSTALITIVVEYLATKGIIRPGFNWKSPTKKLQAARVNKVPLFVKLKEENEIWWLINEAHVPRSKQYFTYFPSVEWRTVWKPQLPPSMFLALDTPVLLEYRGSLARHDKHFVNQRNLLLGGQPLADPDQIDLVLSLPEFPPVEESSQQQQQPLMITLPKHVVIAEAPQRPFGARQMHADGVADAYDLLKYYKANPRQIPVAFLPVNFNWSPQTEYEQHRALNMLDIAATQAAFDIGPPVMNVPQLSSSSSDDDTEEEVNRQYETRAQSKKRSFNEGEDSPSKKNKASEYENGNF